jgi:two-component system response regulator FixJ
MPNEGVVHVVDDDLAVRQSLSFLLASDGLPVRLHESALAFLEAMKEGAVDFIEKPFDDDLFLAAVRKALRLQEQHAQRDAQVTEVQTRLQGLSERERQVLGGLVAGKANKVIAYDLGISPRTVEIYRANVMTKMQAGSLSELVRMALVVGGLPTE